MGRGRRCVSRLFEQLRLPAISVTGTRAHRRAGRLLSSLAVSFHTPITASHALIGRAGLQTPAAPYCTPTPSVPTAGRLCPTVLLSPAHPPLEGRQVLPERLLAVGTGVVVAVCVFVEPGQRRPLQIVYAAYHARGGLSANGCGRKHSQRTRAAVGRENGGCVGAGDVRQLLGAGYRETTATLGVFGVV